MAKPTIKRRVARLRRRYFPLEMSPSLYNQKAHSTEGGDRFGEIRHNPLISVIAVNFNGAKNLPVFLDSLAKQSYDNFELIIVDNCSRDNSIEIINHYRSNFQRFKLIESAENLGFAGGNNLGFETSQGELIALLNIDTRAPSSWLKELIDAIRYDSSAAAVTSKTLFYTPFVEVLIYGDRDFSIDQKALDNSLDYKKSFLRHGSHKEGQFLSKGGKLNIALPNQEKEIEINLHKKGDNLLSLKIGYEAEKLIRADCSKLKISTASKSNSRYIINNAGSMSGPSSRPVDRGINEYDNGQYDQKCYLDYMCGCSLLIRKSALLQRGLFVAEFFAYYEDSELSLWLRREGYRILYAPKSVVYHWHAGSSIEGSPTWQYLVTRANRIFDYALNEEADLTAFGHSLNHINHHFSKSDNINPSLLRTCEKLNMRLLKSKQGCSPKGNSICIYNTYWNSMGGGESHAISFAQALEKYGKVYLLSENDFNIEELSIYYGIELNNCQKLVVSNVTEDLTSKFDVFINSTYCSNLCSKSKKSYYIVSFPHKNVSRNFLSSYHFLFNGDYSKRWAHKLWGEQFQSDIIYPLGTFSPEIIDGKLKKEKIILSVGRFFPGGHSKRQLDIAKAFIDAVDSSTELEDWKLLLVGSLDPLNHEDVDYVKSIESVIKGSNSEVICNASRASLVEIYKKSYLYIHAAGLDVDINIEPENFEHFGITNVEAMCCGCSPLVYDQGGPAELVKKLCVGETFRDFDSLINQIKQSMHSYPSLDAFNIARTTHEFIEDYNFKKTLSSILDDDL